MITMMNRYGGPGTQTVDHRWGIGWNTYLASKRDFVVANIDVRGSGFQVRLMGDTFYSTAS
jgi:dipeptidyl aminopeptidase/acylaminoacyl peptidase